MSSIRRIDSPYVSGPAQGPSTSNARAAPPVTAAPSADDGLSSLDTAMGPSGPVLSPAADSSARLASAPASALWAARDTATLPLSQGARTVPDRRTFEVLAKRDDVAGVVGTRAMKFLITDVDGPNPSLYFVNSNNSQYHYDFASKVLGMPITRQQFDALTYFRDGRKNLAGTLVAHDNFEGTNGQRGLYTLEFWPTDPVKARHVGLAFNAISKAMPFAAGQLRYHPAGDTQEALFRTEQSQLQRLGVRSLSTTELFKNVSFSPLNLGEGYGVLRLMDGAAASRPPSVRDVVIFKSIPNDISHVGGILTETPQTPLSHINLKAKQNDTPNAYLKNASTDPRVAPFIGKLVRYQVTPDGVQLRGATAAEADAWLEKVRPKTPQTAPRDLTVRQIRDVDALGFRDARSVGAKAANVGELRRLLGPQTVPDGFAIPFSFYDDFMKANGLYEEARRMMADPSFQRDPAVRERRLGQFQRRLRDAPIPTALAAQITALQRQMPAGMGIRCRSSTNNEDLQGFNGAGLYDSFTHRPDEGNLGSTVKQVWASLWNYRAFEEREFHRIDHLSAAMGVLVHPNFDDEVANGVAVTKNIYEPTWRGHYVNVQVGESLVTNPDPNATPDELLISAIGERGEYETQFLRHSSLKPSGQTVLTRAQTAELTRAMDRIQDHFKRLYGRPASDTTFAMDLEFKIDRAGRLVVKQARPWVD